MSKPHSVPSKKDTLSELRILHEEICTRDGHESEMMMLVRRGADEIERLRAALEKIITLKWTDREEAARLARAAISGGSSAPEVRQYEGTHESFYCPNCDCARCGNTRPVVETPREP